MNLDEERLSALDNFVLDRQTDGQTLSLIGLLVGAKKLGDLFLYKIGK